MTGNTPRNPDRVEEYIEAVDRYQPRQLQDHEDEFRLFARYISRSLDARYIERHPIKELLPDLEHLMECSLYRQEKEIKVNIVVSDDGTNRRGILAVCIKDRPFLISAVRQTLDSSNVRSFRSINCVMPVRRGNTGVINAVGTVDGVDELVMWIEIEADLLSERHEELRELIRKHLDLACRSVECYPQMRTQVEKLADQFVDLAELKSEDKNLHESNAEFLRWLLDDHFIFLGTQFVALNDAPKQEWHPQGVATSEQGKLDLQGPEKELFAEGPKKPYLTLRKSHSESWIYRPGLTDRILVWTHNKEGVCTGLLILEGLFSFQALAEPKTSIPLLDVMLENLFSQLQANRGSHRHRTIRNAFNSLPLEYLFSLQLESVRNLVEQLLDVDNETRLRVHITRDDDQAYVFVFLTLPRAHYSDELRADIRRLLKSRFKARSVDSGVYAGGAESVAVHYFLTSTISIDDQAEDQLIEEIDQLSRPWKDRLTDELMKHFDQSKVRQLHSCYSSAFPRRYREETSIGRAVRDIELLEELHSDGRFNCDLYREKADKRLGVTRLRLFQNQKLLLSDILPILDNLGLVVIDQFPTEVHVPGRPGSIIATFRIGGVQSMNLDLLSRRNRLTAAVRAAIIGALDNDPMNRLLLRADIPWTYVVLIRAYQAYARQLGSPYGNQMVREALERHADIVRALTELFRAKFDPNIEGLHHETVCEERTSLVERSTKTVLTLLDGVSNLTSDQILRMFLNLIESTMRTNFYARSPLRSHEVVLKFDPHLIHRMPDPKPFREIYVHHPLVAGLHLRGGKIARGGIRWSDRRLDFRKEVLGLMATQNLKNVLIVPRGAKGAFIVRKVPTEAKDQRAAAERAYKHFIGGILSVTDNLIEGAPVTPPGILCYDAKDHYLVVAADKGTAHLSDTANGIAIENKFWLGDAFASGGSKGYDHKVDGITAKGAWECVKRHFHEIGLHPERDQIKVVGIGDMSGDVFGNGMLLSKTIKLVAAFDHRHVFLDPNPEPDASHTARQELFDKGRTSWDDYPKDLISEGGGVFPRDSKTIRLTPQVKSALQIEADALSGQELIQCILSAPADLLWNGGIGTYIRADDETDLEVGDPSNDPVRVDATMIRATVIGEGGNLGITAKGRIQLASNGVRLNTDALDNSAGVDLSDHEVNLKILFQQALSEDRVSGDQRDSILEEVRVEVNSMCRQNNWVHSRMISMDKIRSTREISRFKRAIDFLSQAVPFSRQEMYLPDDATLSARAERGEGLYRPELAALAANAKLYMLQTLAESSEFDLDRIESYLTDYFPESVVNDYKEDVLNHPLGVSIARMMLTNRVIGDAGSTWLSEILIQSGRQPAEVISAYLQASELLSATELKAQINEIEADLKSDTEYLARLIIEDATEGVTNWLLRRSTEITEEFTTAFNTVLLQLSNLMPPEDAELCAAESVDLRMANVPRATAELLAMLCHYEEALDIAQIVTITGKSVQESAGALYSVGHSTSLMELIRNSIESESKSVLDRPARSALRDQLRNQLVTLSCRILEDTNFETHEISEKSLLMLENLQRELAPMLINEGELELCALVIATDRTGRHCNNN